MTMVLMMAVLVATASPQATVGQTPAADAVASAHAAALAQCFVDKTNGADRIAVARWLLGSMGTAPQLADLVKVDRALKDDGDKKMAALFTRLITVDCAKDAGPMLKAGNQAAFEVAGGALGKIAINELLSNPAASEGMGAYTRYLRKSDFAGLMK